MTLVHEPTTSAAELDAIAERARRASVALVATPAADRARWLRAAADALDAAADELVELADRETALGRPRLPGELARTTAQLRLFADAIVEGSWLEAAIDHADPTAVPPHGDLRRMLRPLGPVGVFGASNFPFAFSIAGGDTASALAAGCPVIVKAHPAHPLLSHRTAEIVDAALTAAGAPEGTFALIEGRDAGTALVTHPAVRAVGFTGSLHGGRALFDLAAARPDPIPFYGELSALNPVLITAAALEVRATELAEGLAGSFTLGAGQFCTKPGVVLVPRGSGFADRVAEVLGAGAGEGTRMLSAAIATGFSDGVRALAAHPSVRVVVGGEAASVAAAESGRASVAVFETTAATVLADPEALLVECFGPATLVIEYDDRDEALALLAAIGGSLTATLHAEPGEPVDDLVAAMTAVAGRVLFAGWPTGVAVTWSQQHGGPWPATTSLHTSVGVTALRRFLRPVAYQDAPDPLLPPELRESNPLGIPRRVDGVLTLA
ncbi:aldehyde dehydrogenase (NADP(+)) [Herbiconiux flava]|uniref:NADP-dependent aldehyde dehydrogenase n=1 Tax=Herbiconiux flava TaxID=881268 RepID=A0A852SU96_9MICO|nr:aldehyde dehydrogenase (NADP(+)) [Herbiconiux flava]NYD72160.1 NADP-dependent aldehyde dehydrogenase [Herbiconiux flava]GLK17876.1 aldehyde dehydrogenase [Herbiconiux flava]